MSRRSRCASLAEKLAYVHAPDHLSVAMPRAMVEALKARLPDDPQGRRRTISCSRHAKPPGCAGVKGHGGAPMHVVIVVGSPNSSNSKPPARRSPSTMDGHLYSAQGVPWWTRRDLRSEWVPASARVSVTAGASAAGSAGERGDCAAEGVRARRTCARSTHIERVQSAAAGACGPRSLRQATRRLHLRSLILLRAAPRRAVSRRS